MRKNLLSIAFLSIIVLLTGCGAGSGGSSSEPGGVNPKIVSRVELLDVQNIAQTNSYVYFKAKILDGNGEPVRNEPVIFTNLSYPFGELVDEFTASSVPGIASVQTTVNTDYLGFATIRLFSPTSGFATVQAEVDTGAGWVRDRRTVYFTSLNNMNLYPYLILSVDGDGDGIYNEWPDDYTLFEDTTDQTVIVMATVYNSIGLLQSGVVVTFTTDAPYKVGIDGDCSDDSDTCEVIFPSGNTATTNSSGQASVAMQVSPTTLIPLMRTLNVTAKADNGASGVISLFLDPVVVDTVSVSANPPVVDSGGTSTITAYVTTTAGTPVPDDTWVNFTASIGGIDPYAQTTDGIAEATYTAPDLAEGDPDVTAYITASVGGVSGSTTVTVTAPTVTTTLAISPTSGAVTELATAQTLDFQVSGGLPDYTIQSSSPAIACNDIDPAGGDGSCATGLDTGTWTVTTNGGTFTVTIPNDNLNGGGPGDIVTADSTVTLSVTDSAGSPMVQATITITEAIP